MRRTNVDGTELVLQTARELGLDPIVHVSSVTALLPAPDTLGPDSPIGRPRGAYARSKAEAERVARRMQDEGVPLVITQPGAVFGPHDPYVGENAQIVRNVLRGRAPAAPRGRIPVVDVRDLAAVHAAVMKPDCGPRRYLATGEVVPFDEVLAILRTVTGRRLRVASVPNAVLLGTAGLAEAVQRVIPFRLPVGFQAPWLVAHTPTADASTTARDLGVSFRPAAEAIADTVRWLHAARHIGDRQAGHHVASQNASTTARDTDAAVVGRPDTEYGEVPVAFVVTTGSVTPDDLVGFVRARVAAYKHPHDVRIVADLPRTPSGKLLRRTLRDHERTSAARTSATATGTRTDA